MSGRKTIAIVVAIGVGLLVSAGAIYLYQQGSGLRPDGAKDAAGTALPPQFPQAAQPPTAALPESAPATGKKANAAGAVEPEAEPTTVPSFDVVVIEPDGEGVVAGRAAPGWQVSIQNGGTTVAAATADAQGEWSAVLEKPLPSGDHALSLKITSPDGTRALSSQQRVRVAVGPASTTAAPPAEIAAQPIQPLPQVEAPAAPGPAASGAAPQVVPSEPAGGGGAPHAVAPPAQVPALVQSETRAESRSAQGPALALSEPRAESVGSARPAQPTPALVFKTVDYKDTGSATGTIEITGTSDPGANIAVFYDDAPLGTVRADREGKWRIVAEKKLKTGQHSFRAERLDATTGASSGQAVVTIERMEPKAPEVAAREIQSQPRAAVSSSASDADRAQRAKDVYTIRRGDTLWAIAKRYLGSGLRYPTIFQDNRQTINDPDLIHPQQQVTVPNQ